MPNQKGSLVDRLRSWNLFLKYKFKMLRKKQEEKKRANKLKQELKQNIQVSTSGKYYSKPKIFGLTIAGLFLGIFESKADKQSKISQLENKISILEKRIDTISHEEKKDITYSIEVEIVELKLKNKFNNNVKSRIEKCENRLETVKYKNTKINNFNSSISLNCDNNKQETNQIANNQAKGVYTPVLEIKVINKQIKDYEKKLKEINEKIKSVSDYNSLYELEFSIKQLKLRFNDLLSRYENLKNLPGFYNLENIMDIVDIDIYNLRFDASNIIKQIKNCNNYLDNIEIARQTFLNKKEQCKEEKKEKKENKKKEKEKEIKKEEKKIDNKILEIQLANKIILDKLANEKRNIAKLNRSISKMGLKQKRRSIFYYTKNLLSSIVNFSLGLFPISLFKNKFIGGLVSGIMINNSLRSVRKVLRPDVETLYILYSDFENELNQTSDYLSNISYVCSDSLNQINEIRNTIYMQYGSDLEYSSFLGDYLKELDTIETQVLTQKQTIIDLQEQIKTTKQKNKQKVRY